MSERAGMLISRSVLADWLVRVCQQVDSTTNIDGEYDSPHHECHCQCFKELKRVISSALGVLSAHEYLLEVDENDHLDRGILDHWSDTIYSDLAEYGTWDAEEGSAIKENVNRLEKIRDAVDEAIGFHDLSLPGSTEEEEEE